jgi:hypothetical protein
MQLNLGGSQRGGDIAALHLQPSGHLHVRQFTLSSVR